MFPPFLYDYDSTKIVLSGGSAQLILPNTFATITIVQAFNASSLMSITETVTKSASDDVRYQFKVSGVLKYFNGSAWAASDGTYAQSNSAATVNANASTLIASPPEEVQVIIVLKGSGSTTPSIDNLVVEFDQTPVYSSVVGQCTIYCYLKNILGEDLTVADNAPKLVAINDTPFSNAGYFIPVFTESADFAVDSFGLVASLSLKQTEDADQKIRFMITYLPSGQPDRVRTIALKPCVVPNQSQVDLTTITEVDTSQLI